MKSNLLWMGLAIILVLSIIGCKAKKNLNDPTVLEVHVLAELKQGIPANKVQEELKQFKIIDIKATNKTLNQYIYKVVLEGQSADELLRAFNEKPYIKSAIIAPSGDGPAENLPPGKPSRTNPVKG